MVEKVVVWSAVDLVYEMVVSKDAESAAWTVEMKAYDAVSKWVEWKEPSLEQLTVGRLVFERDSSQRAELLAMRTGLKALTLVVGMAQQKDDLTVAERAISGVDPLDELLVARKDFF